MDAIEPQVLLALDEGRADDAVTLALRGYGPQILGYLSVMLGNGDAAGDAFGQFAERLWRGLPGFRRASSLRTWAYRIAWNCAQDALRDPFRRRARTLGSSERSRRAAPGSSLPHWQRTPAKLRLAELRQKLRPCEQTLLVLRLDRGLSWREVAAVLAEEGRAPPSEAALRKRFEALKDKLRRLLRDRAAEAA
jgi:RNA polymerase sigma-70 factor (ECF subfamily)